MSNVKGDLKMIINFPSDMYDIKLRIQNAVTLMLCYGNYNNNELSQWVIDQTIRELLGSQYWEFKEKYEAAAGRVWDQGKSMDQLVKESKEKNK